jgi:hypothetical protein
MNLSVIFKIASFLSLLTWLVVVDVSLRVIIPTIAISLCIGWLSAFIHFLFNDEEYSSLVFISRKTALYSGLIDALLVIKLIFYSEGISSGEGVIEFSIIFSIVVFLLVTFFSFSHWSNGPISEIESDDK